MPPLVIADLEVGQEIGRRTIEFGRDTLVRYAGASGDFNPIHYNDVVAEEVGLPGVIAHGMLTMGTVVDVLVERLGDPARLTGYAVRFTRPVPVPNPGTASVEVIATVGALDAEAGTARIDLLVQCDGQKVLTKAQATIR